MNDKEEANMPGSRHKPSGPHKPGESPALQKRREIPRFARNDGQGKDGSKDPPLQLRGEGLSRRDA